MIKTDLITTFDERYQEIEIYLSFLYNVEGSVQNGLPRLSGFNELITPDQQKILKSSLYLQLYNLIESTVSRCIEAVTQEIEKGNRSPKELGKDLRKEWVRSIARTHQDNLGSDKCLEAAIQMCEQLLQESPIKDFTIESGGGGNWDDFSIEKMCERLGCSLTISPDVLTAAKRHRRNEMGALGIVKSLRNNLAHGSMSFAECGDIAVSDLQEITIAIGNYLRETIHCFINFIESNMYKSDSQREEEMNI